MLKIFLITLAFFCSQPLWGLELRPSLPGINVSGEAQTWIGPGSIDLLQTCPESSSCTSQGGLQPLNILLPLRVDPSQDFFLSFSLENLSQTDREIYLVDHWLFNTELSLVQFTAAGRTFYQSARFRHGPSTLPTKSVLGLQISVPPGKSTYLVKIKGESFYRSILKVWDKDSFGRYTAHELLLTAIMNTSIFWVTFLTFCAWIVTRLRIFFWIPPALSCVLLGDLTLRGYYLDLFRVLDIDLYFDPYSLGIVAYPIGGIFLIQITRVVLKAEDLGPTYNKALNIFQLVIAALAGIGFSDQLLRGPFTFGTLLLVPVAIYSTLYKSYRVRRRSTLFLLSGFSTLVISVLVPVFLGADLIDSNLLASTSVLLGVNIISITIAFAMSELMKSEMQVHLQNILVQEAHRNSLESARSVQQSLLPRASSSRYRIASFYKPAEVVGGDAFFHQEIGERFFCSIIDVTGHGLSSAILTGTVIGGMRIYFQNEAVSKVSSEELLRELSQELNKMVIESSATESGSSHYVMLMNMVIDPQAGKLTYACAGLSPAFLLTQTGVTALFTSGSPLGFSAEPVIRVQTVDFAPSDKIFCFTDGVIENPGANGRPMRDQELRNFLNRIKDSGAENIAEKLAALINERMGKQAIEDDMTFLVIERHALNHPQNEEAS